MQTWMKYYRYYRYYFWSEFEIVICDMYFFNPFLAAGDRYLFLITSSSLFRTSTSIVFEAASFDLFTRELGLIGIVWLVWSLDFRRVEGGGSNGGTIEVVGGGGCEIIEFRRIGGGGDIDLEIIGVRSFGLSVGIGCELGWESLVLLSSSNMDWL